MGHGHTLRDEHVATGIIGGIAVYTLLERERAVIIGGGVDGPCKATLVECETPSSYS